MDWGRRIQTSLIYIETNLAERTLTPEHVAQACHYSYAHFRRAFQLMTGLNVATYIRQRRLSLAGECLQAGQTVGEVAWQSGYETAEAFAKAFKRFHGVNPSEANEAQLVYFGAISLTLSLQQVPACTVQGAQRVYLSGNVPSVCETDSAAIAALWAQVADNGTLAQWEAEPTVCAIVGLMHQGQYTIRAQHDTETTATLTIEAAKWLSYQCQDDQPETIAQVWEVILDRHQLDFDDYQLEIYQADTVQIWLASS